MDPTTHSQQDNWQNNIYILSTTRVLMVIGLTFLIRSSYQLYQRMRSTGGRVTAAGESPRQRVVMKHRLIVGRDRDEWDRPRGPHPRSIE